MRFERIRAFSIHLLTASGAFLALAATLAAAEGDWTLMFLWLGAALFVDGIDGPLARKYRVREILPRWSGATIDEVIDYATYVFIPALALAWSGLLEGYSALFAAGLIAVTGAIYYADGSMKMVDNCFRGFPVCWNAVIFLFFVYNPSADIVMGVIVAFAFLTFLPIKFVHPVRVVFLRPFTLLVCVLWSGFALAAVWYRLAPSDFVLVGLAATSAYFMFIGLFIQILEHLRAKKVKEVL